MDDKQGSQSLRGCLLASAASPLAGPVGQEYFAALRLAVSKRVTEHLTERCKVGTRNASNRAAMVNVARSAPAVRK